MNANLFRGELVQLKAADPQIAAEAFTKWRQDTEYWRLLDSDAVYPASVKSTKDWLDKILLRDPPPFSIFMIYTLDDDRLIGEVGLNGVNQIHGDTFVGIGLGEREYWDKGYGTDAMRIILRFAFTELNLHRVSLNLFSYNQRAVRSYEKAGFKYEGQVHKSMNRAGQRWDIIFMGILREEWEQVQAHSQQGNPST